MADDWGLFDRDGDAAARCPLCEWDLEWDECDQCGGEGDEDPLWYGPNDTEPCSQCGGTGGWSYCPNPECTMQVVTI